jgi:integrase
MAETSSLMTDPDAAVTRIVGFSGRSKSKAALDARIAEALGEPLHHSTVHDLRRSASKVMAERLGVLPHIVEAILNRISGHRSARQHRTELRWIQDWLPGLTSEEVGVSGEVSMDICR